MLLDAATRILDSEVDAVMWLYCLHETFRGGRNSPLQVAETSDRGLSEALDYLRSRQPALQTYGWTGKPAVHWKDRLDKYNNKCVS